MGGKSRQKSCGLRDFHSPGFTVLPVRFLRWQTSSEYGPVKGMAWVCFTVLMASSVYAGEHTHQVSTADEQRSAHLSRNSVVLGSFGICSYFSHSFSLLTIQFWIPNPPKKVWKSLNLPELSSINTTKNALGGPVDHRGTWLLTGKVRGIEDVVVKVFLHQYAWHSLTLNTFLISQWAHDLRREMHPSHFQRICIFLAA